jgi:hypothetical protein
VHGRESHWEVDFGLLYRPVFTCLEPVEIAEQRGVSRFAQPKPVIAEAGAG